jgi:hypothetical protein
VDKFTAAEIGKQFTRVFETYGTLVGQLTSLISYCSIKIKRSGKEIIKHSERNEIKVM